MSLVNNDIENLVDVDYSTFDLSHFHKTTMDMGDLVPIAVIPTLPGDNIEIDVDAFVRAMPTIAPIMDKIDLKINHFYVPYRILWDKWQQFITQSDEWKTDVIPAKPELPVFEFVSTDEYPTSNWGNWNDFRAGKIVGNDDERARIRKQKNFDKLLNYIGYNTTYVSQFGKQSLMPILAYNKIYQDYYVPQRFVQYLQKNGIQHNLINQKRLLKDIKDKSQPVLQLEYEVATLSTGAKWMLLKQNNYMDLLTLKRVYWNQDYITSALPEPTLFGDVKLPLISDSIAEGDRYFKTSVGSEGRDIIDFGSTHPSVAHNKSMLSNIRDLRKAVSLQHYMEVLTQSGGRYIEALETQWNETVNPELLQMSQYIGGSVIPIFTNEVESTAATDQKPLGALAGKPLGAGGTEKQHFHAQEYGVYMCLAHIVPKRSYTNAVSKYLKEIDVLDFPNPAFEGMGDEAVYNYELGLNSTPFHIYGYVPRYSHYKMMLDRYSGDFQGNLKHWHLGEDWSSFKSGGQEFIKNTLPQKFEVSPESIEAHPRTDVFQVPEEDGKFFGVFNFRIQAGRKLHYNAPMGLTRL